MIPRQELLDLATDFGLAPNVVEKDYALDLERQSVPSRSIVRSAGIARTRPAKPLSGSGGPKHDAFCCSACGKVFKCSPVTARPRKDGDEMFDHYRHTLEAPGNQKGAPGLAA